MNHLRRSRRRSRVLARAVGRVTLTLGLAVASAVPVSTMAEARTFPPIPTRSVAASWGLNLYGALGDGTVTPSAQYVSVSGLSGVVQVAGGDDFSLAVTSDGSVWAWGNNGDGELGDGTETNSMTPVQVMGLSGIIQVAAGAGFGLALRSDGTVWAWGNNTFGELGDGTVSQRLTPVQVQGLSGVTQIAAADYNQGFGLALSSGTVWSWGSNNYGQLGDGSIGGFTMAPAPVPGLSRVTMIAAGPGYAMAVRSRGLFTVLNSVLAWGNNSTGQLGDGSENADATPEEVSGINVPMVAGIAAGGDFAMVLGNDGTVWEWGYNAYGQLGGIANIYNQLTPVQTVGLDSGFTQVAAGENHALALRSDGTVWAWGFNEQGQLGDGTTSMNNPQPVQVSGLTNVTQVAAGFGQSLAVHKTPLIFLNAQHS